LGNVGAEELVKLKDNDVAVKMDAMKVLILVDNSAECWAEKMAAYWVEKSVASWAASWVASWVGMMAS
jgi:hypothetical protein